MSGRCSFASFVVILALTAPAAAVVVEVVDGQTGEAVVGVRYVLEDGTEGQTDDAGRVDVPEGSRVLLESDDHAAGVIEVGSDDQTTELWPLVGWMVQNPGRGMGGIAFGPLYLGEWRDDLQLDEVSASGTFSTGGSTGGGSTVDADLDPGALNDERDFEFDFSAVGGHLALGLPRFEIGPAKFFPAVSGTLGKGYLDFDNLSSADGTGSHFDAEGTFWGFGLDLVVLPCGCSTFFGVAWDFRNFHDDDASHSFPLPSSAQLAQNEADIKYQQHILSVRGGHSFFDDHFSPYLGLQFSWSELVVEADNLQVIPSTPFDQIAFFENRFELSPDKNLHGLAGFDLRLCCLPLFLRAESSFNSEDVTVLTKLVWLLDTENLRRKLL